MSLPPPPAILADPARRAPDVRVDALTFLDREIEEPGMQDLVDAMIIEEMTRMASEGTQASHYLAEAPGLLPQVPPLEAMLSSPAARARVAEMEAAGGAGYPALDAVASARYSSIADPHAVAAGEPPVARVAALSRALDEARVAMEAQTLQGINLELAQQYSVAAWKEHLGSMEKLAAAASARVASITARCERLNAARAAAQEGAALGGPRVKALARKWTEAQDTVTSIELACSDAEREVKRLRLLASSQGLLGEGDAAL